MNITEEQARNAEWIAEEKKRLAEQAKKISELEKFYHKSSKKGENMGCKIIVTLLIITIGLVAFDIYNNHMDEANTVIERIKEIFEMIKGNATEIKRIIPEGAALLDSAKKIFNEHEDSRDIPADTSGDGLYSEDSTVAPRVAASFESEYPSEPASGFAASDVSDQTSIEDQFNDSSTTTNQGPSIESDPSETGFVPSTIDLPLNTTEDTEFNDLAVPVEPSSSSFGTTTGAPASNTDEGESR